MLRAWVGQGYRAVDIDPARYRDLRVEPFDLCRDVMALPEAAFDLIIHNHVLEHVECNYTVVLIRLAKALKPGGTMLFSVPILPGDFIDEIIEAGMDDKLARFGPSLHVRRFGSDVLQRTLGMVFRIPESYDLLASFSESELTDANIPRHHWRNYTGTSIFRVGRDDLRV
jgi:phosphoglycolate phosphatase